MRAFVVQKIQQVCPVFAVGVQQMVFAFKCRIFIDSQKYWTWTKT